MTSGGRPQPAPTPEEVAAIVAAVEAVWPRPAPASAPGGDRPRQWRFSGRWWLAGNLPSAARRSRP